MLLAASAQSGSRTDAPDEPGFEASFRLPDGARVRLNFHDAENYSLVTERTGVATLVLAGSIYILTPRAEAGKLTAMLVGALRPPTRPATGVAIDDAPTDVPLAGAARWGEIGDLRDVDLAAAGRFGAPMQVTVASNARLAAAQYEIATRLVTAMNMTLCGDAVNELTSWWTPELTGAGRAVVATAGGVRLDDAIAPLIASLALPAEAEIIDFSEREILIR